MAHRSMSANSVILSYDYTPPTSNIFKSKWISRYDNSILEKVNTVGMIESKIAPPYYLQHQSATLEQCINLCQKRGGRLLSGEHDKLYNSLTYLNKVHYCEQVIESVNITSNPIGSLYAPSIDDCEEQCFIKDVEFSYLFDNSAFTCKCFRDSINFTYIENSSTILAVNCLSAVVEAWTGVLHSNNYFWDIFGKQLKSLPVIYPNPNLTYLVLKSDGSMSLKSNYTTDGCLCDGIPYQPRGISGGVSHNLVDFDDADSICKKQGGVLPTHKYSSSFSQISHDGIYNWLIGEFWLGVKCMPDNLHYWIDGEVYNTNQSCDKCLSVLITQGLHTLQWKNCNEKLNVLCDYSEQPAYIWNEIELIPEEITYGPLITQYLGKSPFETMRTSSTSGNYGSIMNPWTSLTFSRRVFVTVVKVTFYHNTNINVWVTDDTIAEGFVSHNIQGETCSFLSQLQSQTNMFTTRIYSCNSMGMNVIARAEGFYSTQSIPLLGVDAYTDSSWIWSKFQHMEVGKTISTQYEVEDIRTNDQHEADIKCASSVISRTRCEYYSVEYVDNIYKCRCCYNCDIITGSQTKFSRRIRDNIQVQCPNLAIRVRST